MATVNGLTKAEAASLNQKLATPGAELSKAEFRNVINNFKGEIEAALPIHLKKNADKYARQAITLFSQNPKLQKCTGVTILSALMTATGLGLDLTPQLGQCYIIPYDNRKKDGNNWTTVTEAAFQLGYRGAIALAYRSGEVTRITAEVVHEKDYFEYSKGLNPVLEHRESEEEDRGPVRYVYAVANFKNGGYAFEVWPVSKVVAHAKKFSKSYFVKDYKTKQVTENKNSPWHTDFESMAKKTLIMAIWKYLPLSTELMLAGANDESVKRELGDIRDERDVITITPAPVERQEEGAVGDNLPPTEQPGEIIPEPVSADEPAFPFDEPAPAAPEDEAQGGHPLELSDDDRLRTEIEKIMGEGWLGYSASERAQFYYENSGTKFSELKDIPNGGLLKILRAAQKEMAKREKNAV